MNITNSNSLINAIEYKSITKVGVEHSIPNTQENKNSSLMSIKGIPYLGYAENGETTILGKIYGYDKTISNEEVEDLRAFLYEDNKVLGLGVFMYNSKFSSLLNSTMSIKEFKEKYLEAKAKFEEKFNTSSNEYTQENITEKQDKENSINTIHKETSNNFNFLQTKQQINTLLMLLSEDYASSQTNIDLETLSSPNSLREFVALKTKKVDIKV